MSNRNAMLSFAAALVLTGCASGVSSGPTTYPASGDQMARPSPDAAADGQEALYLGIVDGLIKQSRQDAALAFLDSYRQMGENLSPQYWLLRGNALLAVHRNSDAATAFLALRKTSFAPQGWNGLGRIAAESGDWKSAEASFSNAVEGDPSNADFLNNLAFSELHLNKPDAATIRLRQARELEPASNRILTNLAIALTVTGDNMSADTVIATVKDGGRRDAIRAVVKSAVPSLITKGKS